MLSVVSQTDPRLDTVLEHMRLENDHDFPGCVAKFTKAKYEVLADGTTHDGESAVSAFLDENKRAFPDFHFEPVRISPGPEAIVVEGRFQGTQKGPWRGLPATGRRVDFPMCLVFEFEGQDMVNERIYADIGTPLQQLGVAFHPNSVRFKIFTALTHPITLSKALLAAVGRLFTRKG
jgi:predicted ester cyclase